MPHHTIKKLLLILFIGFTTGSSVLAQSKAAPKRPGFSLGVYIGMTLSEVSAMYRAWEGARAWSAPPATRSNGHSTQMVWWQVAYEPGTRVNVILKDGHVISFFLKEEDEMGHRFRLTESLLNRKLEALNDHQWIDKSNQSKWDLSAGEGSYTLFIYKLGALKE